MMKQILTLLLSTLLFAVDAAAQEPSDSFQVISNPKGRGVQYASYSSFFIFEETGIDKISPVYVVFGYKDEVYIQNPCTGFRPGTYIKGMRDGDTVTVQLPQAVYGSQGHFLVINKMVRTLDERENDYYYDIVPQEENFLTYTIDDNVLSLQLPNAIDDEHPEYIVGLTDDQGMYSGIAEFYQVLRPFNEKAQTMPEGLQFESYKVEDLSYESAFACKVAFADDDDVYITDFFPGYSQYFIKGKRNGDTITFPGQQYQGINEEYQSFVWICAGDYEGNILPEITLACNRDASVLTAEEQVILLNADYRVPYYIEYLNAPIFSFQPENVLCTDPVDPKLVEFNAYDENRGFGSAIWMTDPANVDGAAIDVSKMYFNIRIDGRPLAVTVNGAPTFDIPVFTEYSCDEYEIVTTFGMATLFFTYPGSEYEIQTFYEAPDGTTYSSNAVVAYSGIDGIVAADPVKVEYYNLAGVRVDNPADGLYIKLSVFPDGSRKSEKVILNHNR